MNDAASSQVESTRERIKEAYRGQLGLLRDRIDQFWRDRASGLEDSVTAHPSGLAGARQAARADAVVFFNKDGLLTYPWVPRKRGIDPAQVTKDWFRAELEERDRHFDVAAEIWEKLAESEGSPELAAREWQAAIRCLIRSGRRITALAAIERIFTKGRVVRARDTDGSLVALNEQLLALHLLNKTDPRFATFASKLATTLSSSEGPNAPPIISSQRLFLMDELFGLAPEIAHFPNFQRNYSPNNSSKPIGLCLATQYWNQPVCRTSGS